MPLQPLGENRIVVGYGKQAAQGTAVAATTYPRWEDGTEVIPDLKTENIREGDSSVTINRVIKTLQMMKFKHKYGKARTTDLGFMLGANFGTNSDNQANNGIVGASGGGYTSTITGAHTAGLTTVTVASTVGLVAGTTIVQIDTNVAGVSTAECFLVQTIVDATHFTILTPGLVFAHAGGVAIKSVVAPFTHTFIAQPIRNLYTAYYRYLLGTPEAFQLFDMMFHTMNIDGQAGKTIDIDLEATAIQSQDSTAAMTPVYDVSSGILLYYGGTFSIDGSTVGTIAPYVSKVKINYKHVLDDTMQGEKVTLEGLFSTTREIAIEYEVLWQDFTQIKKAYWNSTTGPDNAVIGTGALDLTWLAGGTDVNNSLEIQVPQMAYIAAPPPAGKLAGKAFRQTIKAVAQVGTAAPGSPEITAILKNGQYLVQS